MTISPARRSAFEILRRVETESAFASVMLASLDDRLREDDRALCHELVLGVLRRRLWLDRSLAHFTNRKVDSFDLAVRLSLELGLYQLRFLSRIPPSAAVNESVNLVRSGGIKSAASFVNGALRRATREPDYDPAAEVTNPFEKIAVETSHPQWLIERWVQSWGEAEARALGLANNHPPPNGFRLTARARVEKKSADEMLSELASAGAGISPSEISPDGWRAASSSGALRRFAGEGLIYFQDEASQLVAHLLEMNDGDRVLDVAAAPGSKATHLTALVPGATIIAGDAYEHRVRTMRELAERQQAEIAVLVHDATRALPFPEQSFDRVLLDAPCSGTGTLRRNPEIRWRLTPADIDDLSAKQVAMLNHAAAVVRRGGRLVYSTCSVEIEENEKVVAAFLAGHPEFVQIRPQVCAQLQTQTAAIRTWPHRQDVDGFFVAVLERTAV